MNEWSVIRAGGVSPWIHHINALMKGEAPCSVSRVTSTSVVVPDPGSMGATRALKATLSSRRRRAVPRKAQSKRGAGFGTRRNKHLPAMGVGDLANDVQAQSEPFACGVFPA